MPPDVPDAGGTATGGPTRRERWLDLLAEVFDPETIERLERLGVGAGWHALEVGAGRGSIAGWLARRVGPGGRVVATDLEPEHMRRRLPGSVEVLRHDVLADDFEPGSFDLVHCRAVLILVSDPREALRRMARWLRPGGVLLAEEPWIAAGRLAPDPVFARIVGALGRVAPHVDGEFARDLPRALREAGLERVEAEGRLEFFAGDSPRATFFRMALEQYSAGLVEAGELADGDREELLAWMGDPAYLDCGWPRIAAWGRRPQKPISGVRPDADEPPLV